MHILGIGLHLLVAVYFAIHAVRSGEDRYWLFILFMFPLLGSLVYAVAVWLPAQRRSRQVHALASGVGRVLDPGRDLREAEQALQDNPSAGNQLRVADALLEAGQASRAVVHYDLARRGVFGSEPDIGVRFATALLECGRAEQARDVLEELIRMHPDYRSPAGHLIYARAVAATGDRARAREEFEAVLQGFAGLEARARYARVLAGWEASAEARALCADSLRLVERMPRHARELNAAWIRDLRQLAAQLDP